jgi:hypothetical protein
MEEVNGLKVAVFHTEITSEDAARAIAATKTEKVWIA